MKEDKKKFSERWWISIRSIMDYFGFGHRERRKLRRRLYEFFGSSRYSTPAVDHIDQKLQKYLNFRKGFFIEAGASDGFSQSNTYFLERFRSWHGILIEPIPELFERCCRERPHSKVFNCALVANSQKKPQVKMIFSGLMSVVENLFGGSVEAREHAARGREVQKLDSYDIMVPTRTLSSIIDESGVTQIDFMSLDVEGYELEVLKGLQLERHCPRYLLIEARNRPEIEDFLAPYFDLVEVMSYRENRQDLFFKAKKGDI